MTEHKSDKKFEKVLAKHSFVFNPHDNDGEQLTLFTKLIDNGDGYPNGIYFNQELTLNSYGNSASMQLCGTSFTPENLRELANQLELLRDFNDPRLTNQSEDH